MRYIDQDKLYQATESGLQIFEHFYPGIDLKNPKNYFKIRNNEKTASAHVSWYDGAWRITDFGNPDITGLKGIDFVIWNENLSYYEALLFIEDVILNKKIDAGSFSRVKFTPVYSCREMRPSDKKGKYNFTFKKKPSAKDLSAIGRYVTEDALEHFNCRTVEKYEYCGTSKKEGKDIVHIFTATDDYPIFLFDFGEFQKLYRPHEMEKKYRFSYIGDRPKDFICGLEQILEAKHEFADEELEQINLPENKPDARVRDLFRCSGESDALNLYSIGFHPYWLNSESEDFTWQQFKQVNDLCENHYQIMDLDATGQREALRNALKHIEQYTIELPEWLKWKKDWRGNGCKDLKDFINLAGDNKEATRFEFLVLKNAALRVKFWFKSVDEKTKKENYSLNMEDFYFFMRANGFYMMESSYHKGVSYCYVKIDGKAVDLIHPDQIKRIVKRYTKNWIKAKKLMDAKAILNKLNGSNQISEANLDTLPEIKLSFKNYNRSTEYLHFKNISVMITKDSIETVKHVDVPNYILRDLNVNNKRVSHLIDKEFRLIKKPAVEINATKEYQELLTRISQAASENERTALIALEAQFPDIEKYSVNINDDFYFVNFLRDISRLHWRKSEEQGYPLAELERKEENLAFANLCFILGYHCAQHKDSSKAWLTLLQDNKISELGVASGGSGKSLLSKAITFVRASFYKPGRALADKDVFKFFYDGLTEFHDFIEIDDMWEHAEFGFFYTQITGPREVNPKNYSSIVLPYEDSGKMLISYNYVLPNTDSSTARRILNATVSDYYHEKTKFNDYKESRSPYTKYGRQLYDDFTTDEWIKFYNFIAYCIQLYQRFYRITPPMANLEKRQLRKTMASGLGKDEEFFTWANSYFVAFNGDNKPQISPADIGYYNSFIIRENAFENFKAQLTQKQKLDYRSGKFRNHVQAWCDYYNYELNPEELCSSNYDRRIIKTVKNREDISCTKECFFISVSSNKMPPAPSITNISDDEEDTPF